MLLSVKTLELRFSLTLLIALRPIVVPDRLSRQGVLLEDEPHVSVPFSPRHLSLRSMIYEIGQRKQYWEGRVRVNDLRPVWQAGP